MRYDMDCRKSFTAAQDAENILVAATLEPGLIDHNAAMKHVDRLLSSMAGTDEEAHWYSVAHQVYLRIRVLKTMAVYTGYPRQEYRMVQDPQHPWMWAVRDEQDEDHLVNLNTEEVEWVEYTSWPPRSFRS